MRPLAAATLRVLFLGNSLTEGNNVPALVQAMARLQGVELQYLALTPGGYAIEDHWLDGHQALLASGDRVRWTAIERPRYLELEAAAQVGRLDRASLLA